MTKAVYEWELDYGRYGRLAGVLALTEQETKVLSSTYIYFGEALGKHTEVTADDGLELSLISEDPVVVAFFEEKGPFGTHIPWDCIKERMLLRETDRLCEEEGYRRGDAEEDAAAYVDSLLPGRGR